MADINKQVDIIFNVVTKGSTQLSDLTKRVTELGVISKGVGDNLSNKLGGLTSSTTGLGMLEKTALSTAPSLLGIGAAGVAAFTGLEAALMSQQDSMVNYKQNLDEIVGTEFSKTPSGQMSNIAGAASKTQASLTQLKLALSSLGDAGKKLGGMDFKTIQEDMRNAKFEPIDRAMNPKNIDSIRNSIKGLTEQAAGFQSLNKEMGSIIKTSDMMAKAEQRRQMEMKKTAQQAIQDRTNTAMNFLSILFVGQMVERFFKSLAATTLATFMKIADSTNTAKQSVVLLSASWEYLKFTVGNAIATVLEPLIPTLVRVVEVIADWIQQHPKLTTGIVATGIALGVFMSTLGNVWLLGASLINIYELMALKSLLVAANSAKAGVGLAVAGAGGQAAKTGFMAALMGINPLIAGLLLLGVAALASILSFEGLREINAELFTSLWPSIEGTTNRLLKVFGVNVELGDTFRYLGSIATWLFAGFANGLQVVITTFGILATLVIDFGKIALALIIHEFGNLIDSAILLGKILNVVLPKDWEIDLTPFENMKTGIDNTVNSLLKSVGTDLKHLFDVTPAEQAAFDERARLIAMGPSGIFEESKKRELKTFRDAEKEKTSILSTSLTQQQALLSVAQTKKESLLGNALAEQTKQPFQGTVVSTTPLSNISANSLLAKESVESLFNEELLKSIQDNYNAPLADSDLLTTAFTEKLSLLNGAIGGEEESLIPTMTTLNLANDTFISNLNEAIPLSADHTAKMNLESEAARKLRIESDSAATALERLNKARERALFLQAGGSTQTVRTIKNSSTFKSTAQGNK